MERSKFESIMNDEDIAGVKLSEPGCNALKGLIIIQKYMPTSGITGAEHDVIYSVAVERLVDAGITEEDAKELCMQNWMIEDGDDVLACYV